MNIKTQKFFNSRPIFYGFLTLLLATASAKYIFSGNLSYIILILAVFLCLTIFCLFKKKFLVLIAFLSIFLFGIGWFFVGVSSFEGNNYEGTCQVCARISDDIQIYNTSASLVLKDVTINGKKEKNINLKLFNKNAKQFQVGDVIVFESEIEKVHLFELGKFNSYYYRDRTAYISSVDLENVEIVKNKTTWDESFRLKIKSTLYETMGSQNGAVAYAVLFGDKSGIDVEIKDVYKSAGTVHLLTVSGLHVSFLIALIGIFLKFCKIRGIWNFLLCATILFVYAYLCGFAPSILRAGIMGLVLLTAKLSGKCYDNLNSLGLAGLIILLIFPLSGLDIGFLMSFFCVLGNFICYDWIFKLLEYIFPKNLAKSFAVSISATLGILPFSASIYSTLNLLTFFINLLVIPIFSILYPVLFISSLICSILPFFSVVLKICSFGFDIIYKITNFFSKTHLFLNLSEINVVIIAFLLIFVFLISKYFMVNKKLKSVVCSILSVLCLISFGLTYIPIGVTSQISCCYYYSDSTVLLTNSAGKSIIVDIENENFTKKLLKSQNISNVDTAFLLQNSCVDVETSREFGISNIIRCDSGEGFSEEILVELDEVGDAGNFGFVYKSYNGKLVGLEVSFDNVKIFLFKDVWHSESEIESVTKNNYDFVFVGKQTYIAKKFERNVEIYSYYKNDYANFNYKNNGNMKVEIEGKNLKWRCID